MTGSALADSGGTSDFVARYQGTVIVRLRAYTYHGKGTVGGEMTIHQDRLEFRGIGWHRLELRRYEISRERVEAILEHSDTVWFLPKFRFRRYGIRVVSKPGGAFGDHDEYRFTFDSPPLEEVLATLRAAGYPVPSAP